MICLTFLPSSLAIAFTVMVLPVPDCERGGEGEKKWGERRGGE